MTGRIVLCALLTAAWACGQARPDAERWNKVFSAEKPGFNAKPNAFLVEVSTGRKPGRALDIGMGQGRNSIYLARQGWDVTGIDISEEGIRKAKEQAARLGLKLNAVLRDADEFDYGREQWDLVVGMYMHGVLTRNAARIRDGLRTGGLLVVEGFHRDVNRPGLGGGPLGYPSNALLEAFLGLRVLRYEDTRAIADWAGMQEAPVVRMLAVKP